MTWKKNAATLRDLTKPIGALNEKQCRRLKERVAVLGCHHSTHYSAEVHVLHFLIRREPFTTLHLDLQSGCFDVPDRLFLSVERCWNSVNKAIGDVKELTPEWCVRLNFTCAVLPTFYMFFFFPSFFFFRFTFPEMFVNSEHYHFGACQGAEEEVNDVELPPWANGSAHEFIRLHRDALESEQVSAHLHEWINLIFGVKQQGDAGECVLTFLFLFYFMV